MTVPESISSRPRRFAVERPPVEAVTDTVHLGQGSYATSSSVLVIANRERIVVNTTGVADAPALRIAYDEIHDGPIRHLVFTQGHPDHYGGHEHLSDDATEIVAHHRYPDIAAEWRLLGRTKGRRLPVWFEPYGFMSLRAFPEGGASAFPEPPAPHLALRDDLTLDVDGRRVDVLVTPGAEATDALTVWLPDERVAIVGNMFGAIYGHMPNLQTIRGDRIRDPLVIIDTIDRILALDPEILVVGHHSPIVGRAAVHESAGRVRDATRWVHDRTVEGLEAGHDVATLMAEIRLPDELEVLQGYGDVSWCVRAIATHYLGWFEARSTVELYPTRAEDIAPDLVALCGGVDPLVERAQQTFAAGDAVRALQLVEVALAVAPDDRAAVELYASCHERLYDERPQDNVWRDGWLRWHAAEARRTGRRPSLPD